MRSQEGGNNNFYGTQSQYFILQYKLQHHKLIMHNLFQRGAVVLQKIKTILQPLSKPTRIVRDAQINILKPKITPSSPKQTSLPKIKYEQFTNYMLKFYNSMSQNGRVNGQHIVFVAGAHGVGKTDFINTTVNLYKSKKILNSDKNLQINFTLLHSPESYEDQERLKLYTNQFCSFIKFDYGGGCLMTQQAFFERFCQVICKQIEHINREVMNKTGLPIITAQKILQINLKEYFPTYFINIFKGLLSDILNNVSYIFLETEEEIAQFVSLCEQFSEIQIIETSSDKIYKQYESAYMSIIQFIAKKYGCSELSAALMMGLQVFSKMELETRPKEYEQMWYQSGIQRTQFLFNVLNYICGFGAANREAVAKFMNNQSSQLKQGGTFIDQGNHVDVIMIIEHLQKLSCYGSEKFLKWFDYVLGRLYNSSNLRSHFPIVIEVGNSHTLFQLRKLAKYQVDNPTVLQIPGYFQTNIHNTNLPEILEEKDIKRFFKKLGRNPSVWNQSFYELAKGSTIEQVLAGQTAFTKHQETVFHSKINKLALFPQMLPLIDQGKLKSTALMYMKLFKKTNGLIFTERMYYDLSLFECEDFAPLYKLNIAYRHFYQTALDLVDSRYLFAIDKVTKQYLSRTSFPKQVKQRIWRWMRYKGLIEFNRGFNYRQLKYSQKWQIELFKTNRISTKRDDYHLRDYYGSPSHYNFTYYQTYIKQKYNL